MVRRTFKISAEGRRRIGTWAIISGIFGVIALTLFLIILPYSQARLPVWIGDSVFDARIAQTESELKRGLSGTKKLANNEAMLFVFAQEAKYSIWMKDMHIPIDVIWLDSKKNVVHIVRNMTPLSYPKSFKPTVPARYVIEVPAGMAKTMNITVGSSATFEPADARGIW